MSSKFKYRAFVSQCVGCSKGNVTLRTLLPKVMICDDCNRKLMKDGEIPVGKEVGKIIRTKDGQLYFVPSKEIQIEDAKVDSEVNLETSAVVEVKE